MEETLAVLAQSTELDALAAEQIAAATERLKDLNRAVCTLERATRDLSNRSKSFRATCNAHFASRSLNASHKSPVTDQPRELAELYNDIASDFDASCSLAFSWTKEQGQQRGEVLTKDGQDAMASFVEHSLRNLDVLAHGLAKHEGHALSALLPQPDSEVAERSPIPPLKVLLRLICDALGGEALRDFVVEVIRNVMLLWRRGVTLAREQVGYPNNAELFSDDLKELDSLMIALLDMVESFQVECMPATCGATRLKAGHGGSPLRSTRIVQLLLVEFINEIRSRQRDKPGFDGLPALPEDNTWSSALSNLVAAPFAATSSTLLSSFGPTSSPEKENVSSPPHSRKASEEGLDFVLYRHAAGLLNGMACSFPLAARPVPLPQAIITSLLSDVFPIHKQAAAHQKLVAVLVLKWYAFSWLGRILHQPELDIYISPHDLAFALLPLHSTIYNALAEASGYADVREIDEEPESLRRAAHRLLTSFGAQSRIDIQDLEVTELHCPRRLKSVLMTAADCHALYEVAGSTLLTRSRAHSLASKGSSSRGSAGSVESDSSEAEDEETPPTPLRKSLSQRVAMALVDLRSSMSLKGASALQIASIVHIRPTDHRVSSKLFLPHSTATINGTTKQNRLNLTKAQTTSALGGLSESDIQILQEALVSLSRSIFAFLPRLSLSDKLHLAANSDMDDPIIETVIRRARSILLSLPVQEEQALMATFLTPLRQSADQRAEQRTALAQQTAAARTRWSEAIKSALYELKELAGYRLDGWYRSIRRLPMLEELRKPISPNIPLFVAPVLPSKGDDDDECGPGFICSDRGVLKRHFMPINGVLDKLTEAASIADSGLWSRETSLLGISPGHHGIFSNPFHGSRSHASRPTAQMLDHVLRDFGAAPAVLQAANEEPEDIGLRAFKDRLRLKLADLVVTDLQADGLGPLSLPLLHTERLLAPSVTPKRPAMLDLPALLLREAVSHSAITRKLQSLLELVAVQNVQNGQRARPSVRPRGSSRQLSASLMPARPSVSTDSVDALIASTEGLIASDATRPLRLLLSLQIMAELTPENVLDLRPAGKAFCDVTASALSWKRDALAAHCRTARDQLSSEHEDQRERAKGILLIAALEGDEEALSLLPSLGLA